MEITDVKVSLRNDPKLRAYVTVTFDNCFVVRGMKVIEGNNGLFVAMPSRKAPDGKYHDIAHPINSDMRRMLEDRVLEVYQVEMERTGVLQEVGSIEQ